MKTVKLTLKTARKISGLTAKQASKAVKINVGTLLDYENSKVFPRVDVANELAKLYGFKFNDIDFF